MALVVRFWGVRGSIACAAATHTAYGGNTSCVEVLAGDQHLIIDAGTGIRELGKRFAEEDLRHAHVLFSHTHWDHIQGFPFFSPLYRRACTFDVYAGHLHNSSGIRAALAKQMEHPMFPIPMEAIHAKLGFHDFQAGETLALAPGLVLKTAPLRHPDGATGYRVEYEGKSFCYVTDTEHVPGRPDEQILELIADADLVAYDSTYTDQEFPERVGWGHSTWQEGVRLCKAAGTKALAIFHHDPDHDDAFMAGVEREARAEWGSAFVAREGAVIML